MSEKPEKIIVVKERRSGCLTQFLLIVGVVFAIGFYLVGRNNEDQSSQPAAASRDPNDPPSRLSLDFMLQKAAKKYLNDPSSYSPIETKIARHPDGYFFFHEFRAKNPLGAIVKSEFGLLYSTNSTSWTFVDRDALPAVMNEITIDPSIAEKMD